MRQVDQHPRDYRVKPARGEPVLVPGAPRRMVMWAIVLAGVLALNLALYWLISPLEPVVKGFIKSLF